MRKLLVIAAVLITTLAALTVGVGLAGEVRTDSMIAKGEVINDDLFIAGEVVTIDGTINGDVYAAGSQVKVGGEIKGDLIAVAETVEVSGQIEDDVIAAAKTVTLAGANVGDSLTALAETATSTDKAGIGGGVLFAGSNLSISSNVGRGVMAGAGRVTIDGAVARSVKTDSNHLTLGPNARIKGDVAYSSANELTRQEGAEVNGKIEHLKHPEQNFGASLKQLMRAWLLWSYLAALVAGAVLLSLLRKPVNAVASKIASDPATSITWGGLISFAVIPAAILLALTIIGLPLAALLLVIFGVLLYLSKIFVGLAIGELILRRFSQDAPNLYASFVVGLSVLYLLKLIPLVNVIAVLITIFAAVGAVVLAIRDQRTLVHHQVVDSPAKRPARKPTRRKAK